MSEQTHQETTALEDAKLQFIEAWRAGQHPTLSDYVRHHPQFAEELTEFALDFMSLEAALDRQPEPASPSPGAEAALAVALALACGPEPSLQQARKARGWTPRDLADRILLPLQMILWLERGQLQDLPVKLLSRLGELFGRPAADVLRMLSMQRRQPVKASFSAMAQPTASEHTIRPFGEALADCDLTDEQRREWEEAA